MRYARVDGLGVFLDLRTSTYRVLNEVATAMLESLIGVAPGAAALESEYDVDAATARAELERFASACVSGGFLQDGDSPAVERAAVPAGRLRGPRSARAWQALASTWSDLRGDGFGTTYERYARTPLAARGAPDLDASVRAFVRAENLWVSRRSPDDCLLRSLALFRFLRSEGAPAEHVIGVRRFPFVAHAWVECDAVTLPHDRVEAFTPLARLDLPVAA